MARQFEDFREAERAGAIIVQENITGLANAMRVPVDNFASEWNETENLAEEYERLLAPFLIACRQAAEGILMAQGAIRSPGLEWPACEPPYCAVYTVTRTFVYFDTQGGHRPAVDAGTGG